MMKSIAITTLLSILAASATAFVPVARRNNLLQLTAAAPHVFATETHGETAANAMDAAPTPRPRSSHTGHAYAATETHGETAANAMDAAAPPRPRSMYTGHAYAATETHGVTSANFQDAVAPEKGSLLKKLGL